jgi:predicted AAA+ superfamily ATPase
LERDPVQFFNLTYLTEDLQMMLRSLSRRFSPEANDDVPGLILAEGIKGQGKSHDLLLIYHLFANAEHASPWMGPKAFPENRRATQLS